MVLNVLFASLRSLCSPPLGTPASPVPSGRRNAVRSCRNPRPQADHGSYRLSCPRRSIPPRPAHRRTIGADGRRPRLVLRGRDRFRSARRHHAHPVRPKPLLASAGGVLQFVTIVKKRATLLPLTQECHEFYPSFNLSSVQTSGSRRRLHPAEPSRWSAPRGGRTASASHRTAAARPVR